MNAPLRTPRAAASSLLAAVLGLALPAGARAAFEDLGAGARAPGMANAYTAIADDVWAVHYNPAGLGVLERPQAALSYSRLHVGLSDNSQLAQSNILAASPLKGGRWGALGVAYESFGLSGLYSERIVGLSYGRLAYKGPRFGSLFMGLNAKQLLRSFSPGPEASNATLGGAAGQGDDPVLAGAKSKSAIGADLGFLYRTPGRYSIGLAVLNANQPNVGYADADKLPMSTRLGLGYKSLWMNWTAELRQEKSAAGSMDRKMAVAGERLFPTLDYGQFAMRAGLAMGSREYRQASMGLSYRINKFQVDYALLMPMGALTGTMGTHRVGMTFHIGAPSPTDELTTEMVSQMQRLRQRRTAGPGYEPTEMAKPAPLERPELQRIREHILAGEYLMAHQRTVSLLKEIPLDSGMIHLGRRLDVVSAFFPELLRPAEKWEVALSRGIFSFVTGKDREAMLLVSYALSLNKKLGAIDKLLGRMETVTTVAGERLPKGKNLFDERHARAEDAFADNDFKGALDDTQDALTMEPDDVKTLTRLGTNLYMMGYYAEAIVSWRRAVDREQRPSERMVIEAYLDKARKAIESNEPPPVKLRPVPRAPRAAAPPLPKPVRDPRLIERLFQAGMEHYARSEMDQAALAFQRVLELDPDNKPAKRALDRIERSSK